MSMAGQVANLEAKGEVEAVLQASEALLEVGKERDLEGAKVWEILVSVEQPAMAAPAVRVAMVEQPAAVGAVVAAMPVAVERAVAFPQRRYS